MKKHSGIRYRWLTRYVSITAAVVVLLAAAAIMAISGYYYHGMESGLEAKIRTTADFFESYLGDGAELYESMEAFTREFEEKDTLEMEFISTDGRILTSSFGPAAGGRPDTPDITGALKDQALTTFRGRNPRTGERILAVSCPVFQSGGEPAGVLRLVSSLQAAQKRIRTLSMAVIGMALAIILLLFLTGMYFIRSIVTPVAEITETTKRIAAGGYGTQIQRKYAENDDEIGELTRAINNLSLQVSQTERMQSEFLSSVSHELRTPLTAISGWSETLLNSDEMDPVFTRRGVGTILTETRRLTSLVMELLEFSRIQDGRFKLNVEVCDLRSVFEDTIFMYGTRLKQEGISLEYEDSDEDIPEISCDPERMKQVFLNILDNAAKYGSAGGKITCGLRLEEEHLCVHIRDYGQGIPEDELPLVKKKFYKGSAGARGSGIGLAVCEEIVTMHGGELIIENADDGLPGCAVTILLPLKS